VIAEDRYRTKAQLAADSLRASIRRGELAPGERIDIDVLCARLRMSVTPIREALRQLEAEGLVVNHPHREIRVAAFPVEAAAELYELRAVLEELATRLSAGAMTPSRLDALERLLALQAEAWRGGDPTRAAELNERWHMTLYEGAGASPYLREFISRLWNAFPWTTMWSVPGRGDASLSDHAEILQAIRAGEPTRAGELMRSHILRGKQLVVDQLRRTTDDAGAPAKPSPA
jgi:DNA-binding GntR family transcriptional regulator